MKPLSMESYVCAFISKKLESNMSNSFRNNQKAERTHPNKVDHKKRPGRKEKKAKKPDEKNSPVIIILFL